MTKLRRHGVRLGVAAALVGAALTAGASPAAARDGRIGVRETVCAQDLYVRTEPGGAWMGTLYYGQTFTVERISDSGQWVYGFAWGNINRHGWVQNGWFC